MNYKYPDVVGQMRSYWLEGQYGGQLLNGHWGYQEIASESTALLLLLEFDRFIITSDMDSPEILN